MRMAGSPEVFEALRGALGQAGVPEPAGAHMAAEGLVHGENPLQQVPAFQQLCAALRQQGYSEDAAQMLAVEYLEEQQKSALGQTEP